MTAHHLCTVIPAITAHRLCTVIPAITAHSLCTVIPAITAHRLCTVIPAITAHRLCTFIPTMTAHRLCTVSLAITAYRLRTFISAMTVHRLCRVILAMTAHRLCTVRKRELFTQLEMIYGGYVVSVHTVIYAALKRLSGFVFTWTMSRNFVSVKMKSTNKKRSPFSKLRQPSAGSPYRTTCVKTWLLWT